MTIKEIIQRLRTAMDDARGQESHFESWLIQNEGICDAIDALKAKQWKGLTDEDKKEYVAQDFGGNRLDAMAWAEKRLKEKNYD